MFTFNQQRKQMAEMSYRGSSRGSVQPSVALTSAAMCFLVFFEPLLSLRKDLAIDELQFRKVPEPLVCFSGRTFYLTDLAGVEVTNILVLSSWPPADVLAILQKSG